MPTKDINFDGYSLKIKEFKMADMKENAAIAMIAKRGSGKSWVCRDIIKRQSDLPGGMIISPTDKMSSFYSDFFPDLYIHYEFSTDIIKSLLQRQEQIIEKAKQKKIEGKKVDPRVFLLMDDCMSQKATWAKDNTIAEIFMNGRHYQLTYMLTMQYSLGISPELRSNFDYIFLLSEDFISNQKRIYEHYAGMFPSFDSFQLVFNKLTDDFGCMVIDNKVKSKKLTDKIYWYKSQNIPNDFTIGNPQFRKFHERNYDSEWKKKKPPFDINSMISKKRSRVNFMVEKI
jgi:hypothetical protein